jgi:hypothetical protein
LMKHRNHALIHTIEESVDNGTTTVPRICLSKSYK